MRYCGPKVAKGPDPHAYVTGGVDCAICKKTVKIVCPKKACTSPEVVPGTPANGGVDLINGTCTQWASKKYGRKNPNTNKTGVRYCGPTTAKGAKPDVYTAGGVSCHACTSVTPAHAVSQKPTCERICNSLPQCIAYTYQYMSNYTYCFFHKSRDETKIAAEGVPGWTIAQQIDRRTGACYLRRKAPELPKPGPRTGCPLPKLPTHSIWETKCNGTDYTIPNKAQCTAYCIRGYTGAKALTGPCGPDLSITPRLAGPVCKPVECSLPLSNLPEGVDIGDCPPVLYVKEAFPSAYLHTNGGVWKCHVKCHKGYVVVFFFVGYVMSSRDDPASMQ